MSAEGLARWQFGITTVYHFLFVPLTIGLSVLVAGLQTAWVRTGSERFLRLTKFFGRLFLINFALGVVTGIVQEFQFGMNWSDYSRFVGDIFGAPLALEGLLAFFLESTFLGLWIFGWDRLPRKVHLATIWLAAVGTVISAYFILVANSFMQHPVGFTIDPARGRAELIDFGAVLTNPVVLVTFPHTLFAAFMVAGGFVAAVGGWHLRRIRRVASAPAGGRLDPPAEVRAVAATDRAAFRTAVRLGAVTLIVAGLGVGVTGDLQGKVMTQVQPMKMAAAEGLYRTTDHAGFSLITIGRPDGGSEIYSIRVPGLLSFLATGDVNGRVEGIDDLQQSYAQTYGAGDYVPNVPVAFWTFRLMIGLGIAAMVAGAVTLWLLRGGRTPGGRWWVWLMVAMPLLPLFANSFAWVFTEMGRQPWLVFGLLTTAHGVSPGTTTAEVVTSLVVFTLLYGVLAVIELRLLLRTVRLGLTSAEPADEHDTDQSFTFAH